jgi:hypothetical protein
MQEHIRSIATTYCRSHLAICGVQMVANMPVVIKERPILFSTEMVRALLDGRKTQTRRKVKDKDIWGIPGERMYVDPCPYGKVGGRLWVREKIYCMDGNILPKEGKDYLALWLYGCDYATNIEDSELDTVTKTISPIFMPRWCCRINLVLTEVSIERVCDISEADAIAEGLVSKEIDDRIKYGLPSYADRQFRLNPRNVFAQLWNGINNKPGTKFSDNPWVWVLKFEVENVNT